MVGCHIIVVTVAAASSAVKIVMNVQGSRAENVRGGWGENQSGFVKRVVFICVLSAGTHFIRMKSQTFLRAPRRN